MHNYFTVILKSRLYYIDCLEKVYYIIHSNLKDLCARVMLFKCYSREIKRFDHSECE